MSGLVWTVKIERVSPITGKRGWAKVFTGLAVRKWPRTWASREEATRYAMDHHDYQGGRSKVVAVRGAP